MRNTEYHAGKAVIKDKSRISEAMEMKRQHSALMKDFMTAWVPH